MEFKQKYFALLLLTYVCFTNFFFLIWWTQKYFNLFKGKVARIKKISQMKLSNFKNYLTSKIYNSRIKLNSVMESPHQKP